MAGWNELIAHLENVGIAFDRVAQDMVTVRFEFDDGRSEKVVARLTTLRNRPRCELTALLSDTSEGDAGRLLELNAELPCGSVCLVSNKYFLRHVLPLEHTDGAAFVFCLTEFAGRADAIERDVFNA